MAQSISKGVPKYLCYFSYIGTRYSGMQRQSVRKPVISTRLPNKDESIQLQIEQALDSLEPPAVEGSSVTAASSRTDKGVHALKNSFQCHILHPQEGVIYEPDDLTQQLNDRLAASGHEIIIRKVFQVPPTVNVKKNCYGRHYVYRMAICPSRRPPSIIAANRSCMVTRMNYQQLDFEKLQQAMQMFVGGVKNFKTFEAPVSKNVRFSISGRPRNTERDPHKTISSFNFKFITENSGSRLEAFYVNNCTFIEFRIVGTSFLYKQVRRMVGCVVSVAAGLMSMEKLASYFKNPSHETWDPKTFTAPPGGLYLAEVIYDEDELNGTKPVFHPAFDPEEVLSAALAKANAN